MLAGGGARGAYEVGALSALAPVLAARGDAPDMIVGTSIGALNGAFFAARADQPFDDTAGHAVEMWRDLRWSDALRPLVSPSELGRLLGAAAVLARLPRAGLHGLLDPAPLRETLDRLVDFNQIARNIDSGALTAAAVVATAYTTTRSVVFHNGGPDLGLDSARAIDYFSTPLTPDHVLASAAIPGAFPAVEVRRPRAASGWYGDGGVRLNAPLKPALALGADRVVVIGLNSSVTPAQRAIRPDAIDGAAQLLQVVLGDQLADDVATLAAVNETLPPTRRSTANSNGNGSSNGNGNTPDHIRHRRIPYIFIAPSDRLAIGRLARDVYKRHYAGIHGLLRNTDVALLGRVVSAERSAVHGELLSYLFLARQFTEELIALGRHDAERWLDARHDAGLWQIGRLPTAKTSAPARSRARAGRTRTARA